LTVAEVLADIRAQLAWRGPGGKSMGHTLIVIERANAEVLVAGMRTHGTVIAAAIEALERGSSTAPVVEALKTIDGQS
jgi:hypothetical protein